MFHYFSENTKKPQKILLFSFIIFSLRRGAFEGSNLFYFPFDFLKKYDIIPPVFANRQTKLASRVGWATMLHMRQSRLNNEA